MRNLYQIFVHIACGRSSVLLGFNDFDKTANEYSISPTDDLITAGRLGQILRMPYLMNYLSNLDETSRE